MLTLMIAMNLLVFVKQGHAVEINCKYSSDFDWFTVGKVYTCSVQQKLDALHTDSGVIGVNGIHNGKKKNKDVKAIRIFNRNVYYFSSGYDKYFTNIEVIQVYGSKLKIISQKDLMPFTKLKHIDLCKNDLEELEKDLFKFNQLLEVIKVSDNKLKFIDVTAFEGLYQLHTLELNGNHCIWKSTGARDNLEEDEEISREEAIDIMYEARTRCYRDYILRELYEMEMGKFLKERSEVVVSLQSKIDDLTTENDIFYDRMRKYKDELDICLSKEINKPSEMMEMTQMMQMLNQMNMESTTVSSKGNGNGETNGNGNSNIKSTNQMQFQPNDQNMNMPQPNAGSPQYQWDRWEKNDRSINEASSNYRQNSYYTNRGYQWRY
ncbi:unnamed protein product [Chironomus riparius]|uniref:Uncharacterized protein n=1 Tax=Chironomus riparius TaxID=315576 RepID=A0A9N9S622_9DIPT|nr:unnamed protein product [Chironomus riparius]